MPFLCFSSFPFPEVLKWGLLSSSSRAVFKVVECLWSFLAAAQSLNQQKGCKRDTFCQRATSHWTKKGGNSSHFIPILEFVTSTQRQRPSLRSYKGKGRAGIITNLLRDQPKTYRKCAPTFDEENCQHLSKFSHSRPRPGEHLAYYLKHFDSSSYICLWVCLKSLFMEKRRI